MYSSGATVVNSFAAGDGPFSISSGDFNGDGRLDLATANVISDNVSVLLGDGMGSFAGATNISVGEGPRCIKTTDLNGDGMLDLVTGNEFSDNISVLLNSCTPAPTPTPTPTPVYNFTGFFQPVDNLPTLNEVKAGSAIPINSA